LVKLTSLCRQKEITFIFSTSDTRWVNRSVEAYVDTWIVKDLEYGMVKQGSLIKKIIQKYTFISPDGFRLNDNEFLLYNRKFPEMSGRDSFDLPKFWSDEYSKPYKTATKTANKSAIKTPTKTCVKKCAMNGGKSDERKRENNNVEKIHKLDKKGVEK
jgi:hypothetical protein